MFKTNKMPHVSIIIPTYLNFEGLLKPCIESILKYTDMENTELVISSNGCENKVREYVESLGKENKKFKLVWNEEALGYVKAVNEGIKASNGEFVVLLNDDTVLLEQPKNEWLKILLEPFKEKSVGVAGPLLFRMVFWENKEKNSEEKLLDRPFISFWCAAIRRDVFKKVGLLDEIFSPGYGEDVDFCIRAEDNGYKIKKTKEVPIRHLDGQTFKKSESTQKYLKQQEKDRGEWGHIIEKRYIKNSNEERTITGLVMSDL